MTKFILRNIIGVVVMLIAAAHVYSQSVATRDQKWRDDLTTLTSELPQKHKNLFFKMSRADFERETSRIAAAIPKLSDREIKIEFIQLVAMAGDGHTQAWWSADDFELLPFIVYRFSDGWYVIRTAEQYKQIVGQKLIKIGETDIDQAIQAIQPLIACDNSSCYSDQAPKYLRNGDFLNFVKLLPQKNGGEFTFADRSGKILKSDIRSLPAAELKAAKFVSAFDDKTTEVPLYRRNPEQFYWRQYISATRTLYINYRTCREMETLPFDRFADETLKFIDTNSVERIVVDLRQNGGGRESILRPLANGLRDRLKEGGKKVYVVIGRSTYSSANNNAYELKEKTHALFVGEPSGQKPNHYGEVKAITLPNCGLQIGYSTSFFKRVNDDADAIKPDIQATLTFADYVAGKDPALEAILNFDRK